MQWQIYFIYLNSILVLLSLFMDYNKDKLAKDKRLKSFNKLTVYTIILIAIILVIIFSLF